MEPPDRRREGSADESFVGLRVVLPADLERNEPVGAEVDRLLQLALLEVPEVEPLAVAPGLHVREVEARFVGGRHAELARDQRVLARLVPEVVVHRRGGAARLPAAPFLRSLLLGSPPTPPRGAPPPPRPPRLAA